MKTTRVSSLGALAVALGACGAMACGGGPTDPGDGMGPGTGPGATTGAEAPGAFAPPGALAPVVLEDDAGRYRVRLGGRVVLSDSPKYTATIARP